MIKVYYEYKDGGTVKKAVEYVQCTDFEYAIKLFSINQGYKLPKITAMELIR